MSRRIIAIILSVFMLCGAVFAADTQTTNIGLTKPGRGSSRWDLKINSNFDTIDTHIGGLNNTIDDLPEVERHTGTFNATTGTAISLTKSVDSVNEYGVEIVPTTRAGAIGDIWVSKGTSSFTVYCSESNTTDSFEAVVCHIGDVSSYGGSVYRRYYVSPSTSITDHSIAATVGSLAYILNAMSGTSGVIEFPGNRTYTLTANDVTIPYGTELIFQPGAKLNLGSGITVYFNGKLGFTKRQIFDGDGSVEFGNNVVDEIYPEWFGAVADDSTDCITAIKKSIAAMPSNGAIIKFGIGIYRYGAYIVGSDPYKIYFESIDNFALLGSGPGTILKPDWDEITYIPATDGYISLWFKDCEHFEVGNFTYDNGTITNAYPIMLRCEDCSYIDIHDIKAISGGDIQNKGAITIYGSRYANIHHNRLEGYDASVLFYGSTTGQNLASDNEIIGGKSEGISIYTGPEENYQSYVERSTIVSNNYVEGKNSYAFMVYGANNSNVVFTGNTVVGHRSGAFHLNTSSGVTVNSNSYIGGYHFAKLTDVSDISFNNNKIVGGRTFLAQIDDTDHLDGISAYGNTFKGAAEADAYSATITYRPGQPVSYGGNYYYCITETTGNAPSNPTYWTQFTNDCIIYGYFRNSSFADNVFLGGLSYGIYILDPDRVIINNNNIAAVTGIRLTASSGEYSNKIQVCENNITASTGAGIYITGYGIKDTFFNANTIYSEINYAAFSMYPIVVQNVSVRDNCISGATSQPNLYQETHGCAKKINNSFHEEPNDLWFDYPQNGYVTKGTKFPTVQAIAGGTEGYVCTTTGYGYKESYDPGHSYVIGEHVLGSDNNVYICIADDSGSSANAPITGGSYTTYWALVGSAAVFKEYGSIES